MAEIYSDLPSPIISTFSDPRSAHIANRILAGSGPDGLITELYGYQRRSVVAMLQRELPNTRIGPSEDSHFFSNPDPLFVPIVGIDGKEFFYQPAKMTILRERPNVAPTRGGIICEELGKNGENITHLSILPSILRNGQNSDDSNLNSRDIERFADPRAIHIPYATSCRYDSSRFSPFSLRIRNRAQLFP
jgi:hypothetical protein